MKNFLLICLAVMILMPAIAQKAQVKKSVVVRNCQKEPPIAVEPVKPNSTSTVKYKPSGVSNGDHPDIVTILDLGTSANVIGYSGGSRTMLWADDDLNCVINIHRMGPGSAPPSLSGYLGIDFGINMGLTQSDWTSQVQIHAATLPSSPYYYDASRYPSVGIYNPPGNTTLANAFLAYFAPNFANLNLDGFGGYSYGTANLANLTDTIKHLKWYDPTPYTYVPDGFTISKTGIAHMVDIDMNAESGAEVYQDSIIYGRGVWNAATNDFDYTFKTLAFPCRESGTAADCKIAASPDGNTIWISVLTNYTGGTPGVAPLIDSTFYPLLRRSEDGGLTWSEPIPVYLDGPNGISGIKNQYSDYFIQNFFVGPPWPSRDEIPYTSAFDHSLSVDKWGEVHIGVAIGYAPGSYSISTGVDSLINVFDIISCNDGEFFYGIFLGSLKTFRGTWGDYSSDNRVYVSSTEDGDKMFFTWNDTRVDGVVDNQNPDVYARGFNLYTNMITSDNDTDAPNNVTFLSDITQEAYWQCTSPYVFTDNNKYTIPICTQWFADPALDASFKYIPDFYYVDADFNIFAVGENPCTVWPGQKNNEIIVEKIYPNPIVDFANVTVNLNQNATVSLEVMNIVGRRVMFLDKGTMNAGTQQFSIDVSSLPSGIYFITISINGQSFTRKMMVE